MLAGLQVGFAIGMLLIAAVFLWMDNWRYIFGFTILLPTAILNGFHYFIAESPDFLTKKNPI